MTAPTSYPNCGEVLARWNMEDATAAAREILPCCGSLAWAEAIAARRPYASPQDLFNTSDIVWQGLPEDDWREAFASHPRIGQHHAPAATEQSLAWSGEEQSAAAAHDEAVRHALAEANREYEAKFGRTLIVCATGKSAAEIVAIATQRIHNSPWTEMMEAAEQQRQITHLRLLRWLKLH